MKENGAVKFETIVEGEEREEAECRRKFKRRIPSFQLLFEHGISSPHENILLNCTSTGSPVPFPVLVAGKGGRGGKKNASSSGEKGGKNVRSDHLVLPFKRSCHH